LDLQRYFSGWATPVQKLIDVIDPSTTNRIEIHDIDPCHKLVNNRIALLGDAAHSTTPDIGQGGCMALKDAVVMGEVFRRRNQLSIPSLLKEYEVSRLDRVTAQVLKAHKRSEVTHGKDMNRTLAWYNELRHESGSRIISGRLSDGHVWSAWLVNFRISASTLSAPPLAALIKWAC
jgi:FAD-dependent urate hydroxylase